MIGMSGKFLLLDEPGTGKGCSTILGLKIRQLLGHGIFPALIVSPSWDVADALGREIAMWAPEWPEPVMYGGPRRAEKLDADILLTTYATARIDSDVLARKMKPVTVVTDEAHALKNVQSGRSIALRSISRHARNFIALTGTPITRDSGDIFPVLAAMEPESYPSRERFVKRYLLTTASDYGEVIEGLNPLAEPEFRIITQGQMRRVSKADVLDQLPPKVYSVRRVELPKEWRKAYDTLAEEMLAQLPDGGELPVMSVLAQLTRLSQLASSAFDVAVSVELNELGQETKKYDVTLKSPSWKVDALLGILAERPGKRPGSCAPTAVFANSRQLIDIAGVACEKAGYRCGYITGTASAKNRKDDIAAFQAGELDLILATAGAGGLGITLTAAGTAVVLQRSWKLDESIQIEDRLHRLGQKNTCVEIIDIVAKGTVDSHVRTALKSKAKKLSELVRDPRVVKELLGG